MDAIDRAAEAAQPLFRLNDWTWRNDPKPPTLLDLRATFSSLSWELERTYGNGDGSTHYATSGRLLVTMTGSGELLYSVRV